MYQLSYAETVEESSRECRDRERRALDRSIALLEKAEGAGGGSAAAMEALRFARRLWKALIEDLADSENDLPDVLRGDLISIGIWILREADALEAARSNGFRSLIEVSAMIRDGLK
jgi:flagellar protein FlaF